VSRRGKPRYSDNAEAELQQIMLKSTKYQARVVNTLTNDNITFCFIPPSAPHIGESAVKSAKHHLKRVAGNALFSCEEMQTLLTQIEACLNSRPLTTLSSAPNGTLSPSKQRWGSSDVPSLKCVCFQLMSDVPCFAVLVVHRRSHV
jgi:hypothetical protein